MYAVTPHPFYLPPGPIVTLKLPILKLSGVNKRCGRRVLGVGRAGGLYRIKLQLRLSPFAAHRQKRKKKRKRKRKKRAVLR